MRNNVLYMLERNAKEYPNKLALADEVNNVDYKEYEKNSRIVGTFIAKEVKGQKNKPIAVLIDRNIKSIITFMGIIYSGNFYVPIDASMPADRIALIFETLEPVLVIDAREKRIGWEGSFFYDMVLASGEEDNVVLHQIRKDMIDTDPLYAIFTSGSTGVPKGVVVSHRSVLDLVDSFEYAFGFTEEAVFANQAPFDFDVSVKDIYNALMVGGTVQVLPKKLFKMPKLLIEYLCERKVNVLIWAVSALRIVADFKAMEESELPVLDYVMFSGEVMPVKALNYWMDKIPTAKYVNLYGPTEITCNCTYYEVNRRFMDDEMLPVGKAFKNTRVVLRNDKNEVIKTQNEVGEICVMGTCLALGYWNNKEKTDEAFLRNPMISSYEVKMYATGDLGYYNEEGDIVFASRRDFQIKHMGHRIELGEVEVALNALSCLTVSCCLYDKKREKIVCFYQADAECKKEIVSGLAQKLPKYMWPNVYVHYKELPMNKNGKIDRVELAKTMEE